jgi:hypothetical protein
MSVFATDYGTDDGCFVHPLRELRKDFANLDAWHIRSDGTELTANLGRSFGFDFPHVLVWRTATQKDIDQPFVRVGFAASIVGSEQAGEG